MSTVAVAGSLNMDLVIRAPHCPTKGETVMGGQFGMAGGGKGSNQALAAARLNAHVFMIGCVGNDDFGRSLRFYLTENGVNCDHLAIRNDVATGTAMITVADGGGNSIVISPGANNYLDSKMILNARDIFEKSDAALFQMETPTETVVTGLKLARLTGCRTFLSAEPPFSLPSDVWKNIDCLILNERALNFYAGVKEHMPAAKMAEEILKRGVHDLIITRSSKGGSVFTADGNNFNFDAFNIHAVDNTGARDAFCAGVCVALSEGMPLKMAVKFASACGAIACTKIGAHPSMPWRHQIGALLGEQEEE